jgi:hypothetical protein
MRQAIAAYKAQPLHKAFVFDNDGRYAYSIGKPRAEEAREDAIRICRDAGMGACELAYVDDDLAGLDPISYLRDLNAELAKTRRR